MNSYLTQPRLGHYSTYSGFIWNFFSFSSKVGKSLRSAPIIQYLSESRLWPSVKETKLNKWKVTVKNITTQQQSKALCNFIIWFQYPEGVHQWSGSQSKVLIVEVSSCDRWKTFLSQDHYQLSDFDLQRHSCFIITQLVESPHEKYKFDS